MNETVSTERCLERAWHKKTKFKKNEILPTDVLYMIIVIILSGLFLPSPHPLPFGRHQLILCIWSRFYSFLDCFLRENGNELVAEKKKKEACVRHT